MGLRGLPFGILGLGGFDDFFSSRSPDLRPEELLLWGDFVPRLLVLFGLANRIGDEAPRFRLFLGLGLVLEFRLGLLGGIGDDLGLFLNFVNF